LAGRPAGSKKVHYVYILQSISEADQWYTGQTGDLKARLQIHNSGEAKHTGKHLPWKLVWYAAFENAERAIEFEKYLKSGSGRAFALRHLR
jgi:putative endonuclease